MEKPNALLPQSELRIVPDGGHEINKSSPEVISAAINSLCQL